MAQRRYHQFCGVARALDVVGERWTLLIARDLLLGGRRFSDLLAAMPGLTPNLLSRRLKDLREHGLVEQAQLPAPAGTTVYTLTERGRELEPVVLALGRFGAKWLDTPTERDRLDPRWAMVSFKRRYVGCPRSWRVGVELGSATFSVEIGGPRAEIADGRPDHADLRIRGGVPALAGLLGRGESARALVDQGLLHREGPARALTDFARAFGLTP